MADDQLSAVGGVHPRPPVVEVLVAQTGVVVVEVDTGHPGLRVEDHGRHAEPAGRLCGLEAEPVRVDRWQTSGRERAIASRTAPTEVILLAQKMRAPRKFAWPRPAANTVTSCPPSTRQPTISRVTRADGTSLGRNSSVTSAMRMSERSPVGVSPW